MKENIREELIKKVENKEFNLDADLWSSLNNYERKFFLIAQRRNKEEKEQLRQKEREEKKQARERLTELQSSKPKQRTVPPEYIPFKRDKGNNFEDMVQDFIKDSKDKCRKMKTEFVSNRVSKLNKSENNKRRSIALNRINQG